jgi:hypothetical protein
LAGSFRLVYSGAASLLSVCFGGVVGRINWQGKWDRRGARREGLKNFGRYSKPAS